MPSDPQTTVSTAALDPSVVTASAAAIVDIWMGGCKDWRSRLDDSTFLESADWENAVALATAALTAAISNHSPLVHLLRTMADRPVPQSDPDLLVPVEMSDREVIRVLSAAMCSMVHDLHPPKGKLSEHDLHVAEVVAFYLNEAEHQ